MHEDHDFPDHMHWHEAGAGGDVVVEDVEGLEMFRLRSVGIDIGSSTSHLIFSRLTLRREGASLSAQFKVTEREVLYRSSILLTPYVSGILIDIDALKEFFESEYRKAGMSPGEIDTGAVVITGEALKKENAQPISEYFAGHSGKFICASAGPNHEALLAAYGSGSVALSEARDATVLNVDVGGGTSKLSLIRQGAVTRTAAVSVGARLVAFDDEGRAVRIEEPARVIMSSLGHGLELGKVVSEAHRLEFADAMSGVLFEVMRSGRLSPLADSLMITDPLEGFTDLQGIDQVIFSGGVSEYVYNPDTPAYGDLGPLFAKSIRDRLRQFAPNGIVYPPTEGIRATVIGAGEYTVQVSGNTSYLSSIQSLPAFGLKVVRAVIDERMEIVPAIKHALEKFDLDHFTDGLALAINVPGQPDYRSLRQLAEGVVAALADSDSPDAPLIIVLDLDVAKSLGGILKEELLLERDVVAIDGIDVGDLDYVDIGPPVGASEALPVTVKSLMFPSHSQAAAAH